MIQLTHVFWLIGAVLAGTALLDARHRRWAMAGFWAIVAVPFFAGDAILAALKAGTAWPAQAMGAGVLALAVLAAIAGPARREPDHGEAAREASAKRLGNALFAPALAIPVLTLALLLLAKHVPAMATWLDPAQTALISLGIGALLALGAALAVTRAHPGHALGEARRLLDSVGWAFALPMLLATLGSVFKDTGVGTAIAQLVGAVIPTESRLACLLAYGLGMVIFTAILGNAFAAFPVLTAGIGVPLLIQHHGAHPAALGAFGMLTGYCGTLLTPMAANFNVVPALLLELGDDYGVIRAQWPTALALIATNLVLMSLLVF